MTSANESNLDFFDRPVYIHFPTNTDTDLENLFSKCSELCSNELGPNDVRVLRACLESCETVVLETEYFDKDYRSAYSGYFSKKFPHINSRALRLHLFDISFSEDDFLQNTTDLQGLFTRLAREQGKSAPDKQALPTSDGYMGNIILRPIGHSLIGKCLLDPRKYLSSSKDKRTFGCLVVTNSEFVGQKMRIAAFPHQRQDAEVNVCAHTAVWSLFRYLSQRYSVYKEQYPIDIAMLNRDLHGGRQLPGRGLYMDQVVAMFGNYGLSAEQYSLIDIDNTIDRSPQPDVENDWASIFPVKTEGDDKIASENQTRDLLFNVVHYYIDSGLPPILGVNDDHAVVACGIEYSSDPQVKRDGLVSLSSDFVSGILVNDDNHAPYQVARRSSSRLPTDNNGNGVVDYCDTVDSIVVPLPDKVFLNAEGAELLSTQLANEFGNPYGDKAKGKRFVRRMHCTSSRNYKHFRKNSDDDASKKLVSLPLPHFLWITEFSDVDDWLAGPKGNCLVEIALDATAGQYDDKPYIWIRYPNRLVINWYRIYGEKAQNQRDSIYSSEEELQFPRTSGNLRSFFND
jgi:hypothetical protein